MIPFDRRQRRQFVAVAEELHFGRVAERLRIAPPALCQIVQRLEWGIGTLLLDRRNRRVRLTDAGTVLLEHARRLLADADDALTRRRIHEAPVPDDDLRSAVVVREALRIAIGS